MASQYQLSGCGSWEQPWLMHLIPSFLLKKGRGNCRVNWKLFTQELYYCHSPTKFLQPANLTTYTILSMFSLQVELAPRLLSSQLDLDHRIVLITNHQPLFHICVTLPVESAPFFISSTPFCSLSSWFTSSCAYHLITVTTYAVITYHCLYISLQT